MRYLSGCHSEHILVVLGYFCEQQSKYPVPTEAGNEDGAKWQRG